MSIFMRIVAKILYLGAILLTVYFAIELINDFGLYNIVDYKESFLSITINRFVTIMLPAIGLIIVAAVLDWKS